jgi:hypothetical protein
MKDREHNGQKFEDTKGVIRRHKSMKDREQNGQKFEDTKEIIRRNKSMKDREHNGQKLNIPKFNQKTQINEGQRTQWPKV